MNFHLNLLFRGTLVFFGGVPVFSQERQPILAPTQTSVKLTSAEFVSRQDGLTIERLTELGQSRRADLLAARERLAIAEGKLIQARLRPNPTLDTEYGSPRFLGGEAESNFSIGATQVFEPGGKRQKRAAFAELETALGITIPPSGFSVNPSSVLPDTSLVPTQIDREKFLKSIETVHLPKKSVLSNAEIKKQRQ